ncbi:hypothetical protein GGR57DRAFT_505874 [Xylariaceae sp. FL1272]|nr:hypothetical protein GGR57DRAFT_505874 [Xylariaceae sp. FL1272]
MPFPAFRRATTLRKKLDNPSACCDGEIPTTRLGRRKGWWACGPAMDKFESEIAPELEPLLRNAGLGYADLAFEVSADPPSILQLPTTGTGIMGKASRACRWACDASA